VGRAAVSDQFSVAVILLSRLDLNISPSPERFHALDAVQAFALLSGVVVHATWSFIPRSTVALVVDGSDSGAFAWFFFASHTWTTPRKTTPHSNGADGFP